MGKKTDRLYAISAIIFTVILTLFRTLVTFLYTESKNGVYVTDSNIPGIFDYSVAVITVLLIVIPLLKNKNFAKQRTNSETRFSLFASAALGFMFIASSMVLVFNMLTQSKNNTTGIILVILGILSSVYYLSKVFSKNSSGNGRIFSSMLPAAWAITALIEVYFDMNVLITSPNRAYHQLALLSFAVFVLAEIRNELKFPNNLLYAPAAACCTVLLAVSSIPNLICPHILSIGNTDRPIIYALELVVSIYAASRLIGFCSSENTNK